MMTPANLCPLAKHIGGSDTAYFVNDDTQSILQKQLQRMEGEVREIQLELAAVRKNRLNVQTWKIAHPISQISELRQELQTVKEETKDELSKRQKYEDKLDDLERKLNVLSVTDVITYCKATNPLVCITDNETLSERLQDSLDEVEELQGIVNEQAEQLKVYRAKYLQAQQEVEEHKRQIELIELDNKQVNDQIHLEIQKIKMQFQEKLQELAPLPDVLKGTQFQLQEAQQLQRLAEDNVKTLSKEVQVYKEKVAVILSNLNEEKHEKKAILEENHSLKNVCADTQKQLDSVTKDSSELRTKIVRMEEQLHQKGQRLEEKNIELIKLTKAIEALKQEFSRSTNRSKERSDSMRRYLQGQISELERQLIQSRAVCRASQKERDEVRQRMQIQINNLNENFELTEMRLRGLQNQVTGLKSSYGIIFNQEPEIIENNNNN